MICNYRYCNNQVPFCKYNPNRKYCDIGCTHLEYRLIKLDETTEKALNHVVQTCAYRNCNNPVPYSKHNPTKKKHCSPYCKDRETYFINYYIAFDKLKLQYDRRDIQFKQC